MYRVHTLPTKPTKDEPTEESSRESSGRTALRSIEDSLVLLQSLRQSRQTWLTSGFVKFSTKSRAGKGSEIWQPLHTVRLRGKCDLEIGPHVFYATSVYEVTYQPYQAPVHTPSPHYAPTGAGWPPTSYTYPSATQGSSTPRGGSVPPVYAPSTTALVSSLKGAVPITNDLISQVNAAAVSNPTLANLLSLAASGTATPEQLQTLGVTIQSLAETALKSAKSSAQPPSGSSVPTPPSNSQTVPPPKLPVAPPSFKSSKSTQPSPTSTSRTAQPSFLSLRPPQAPPATPTPGKPLPQPLPQQQQTLSSATRTIIKEPDVVIEFYENSNDRWTLPKDLVLYERVKRWDGNSSLADIIFSTVFPFEGSKPTSLPPLQANFLPLGGATDPIQVDKDDIHPITLRFFNVPPTIWNLFSKVASDEERTKRVQAAIDAQLDKAAPRAYLQHRIPEGALLTQLQSSASDRYPTKLIRPVAPASGAPQPKRRVPAATKDAQDGSPSGAPPLKRKRTSQAKKPDTKTGKCEVCLRSPVALVADTQFCPTCDKAKKVNATSVAASGRPSAPGLVFVTPNATTLRTPVKSTTVPTPNTPATPATPVSGATKAKKQRKPANKPVVHTPLQTPYAAGRPPIPNYYSYPAWQSQSPYAYQYHPHPQPGSHPQYPYPAQTQPVAAQAPAATSLTQTAPPQSAQAQPAPPQGQSGSTQKKTELAAMD